MCVSALNSLKLEGVNIKVNANVSVTLRFLGDMNEANAEHKKAERSGFGF